MSLLKTKISVSLAQMMTKQHGGTFQGILSWFENEILRLLPENTIRIGITEIQTHSGLNREFIMEFDCPFFNNDFEFIVEIHREYLTDGTRNHFYQQATKIIPVP